MTFPFPIFAPPAVSGGFDPASISGLQLWLDGSDASTITQSGGAISQWNDKSGNANHATQSGVGKPTVVSAAQNGLNGVGFDSASAQFFNLASLIDLSSTGYTCIAVLKVYDGAYAFGAAYSASVGDISVSLLWVAGEGIFSTGTNSYAASVAEISLLVQQVSVDNDGTNGSIFYNGSDVTDNESGYSEYSVMKFDLLGKAVIYSSSFYSGAMICEYLLYSGVLSNTNRQLVEAYLKTKWATP